MTPQYFFFRSYGRFFKESVYFYTFHKSGSSLFNKFLRRNIYLRRRTIPSKELSVESLSASIKKRGFIGAPIRISNPWLLPNTNFCRQVSHFCDNNFIKDKTAIFMIRDPRDILISYYYYFSLIVRSEDVPFWPKDARERRQELKKKILSMSLDEYVLEGADEWIIPSFWKLDELVAASKQNVIIKYEDMITDWDFFVAGLTKYIDFNQNDLSYLFKITRPKESADIAQRGKKGEHKRSGKIEQFRYELKEETKEVLNDKLKPILERFQYPVK